MSKTTIKEKKRIILALQEGVDTEEIIPSIQALEAEVIRTFKYVPYMVIEIPEENLKLFKDNKGIPRYFEDGICNTMVQQVPWGISRIEANKVHSQKGIKGAGVKVGVVDTGIDLHHTDLKVYGGASFVTPTYQDDNGHGTHVSGTIAALDNTIGVIGVAPAAQLYAVKVLDSSGSGYYSDVAAGIEWCIDNKMHIISMSLGGSSPNDLLQSAVVRAYQAGILLVAAAGNSGNSGGTGDNVGYPAKYSEVIAVAATNSSDQRAYFSSTGPAVELAAPGVDVLSTYLNSGYKTLNGTSMATPHVSGLAALVKSANPTLTNVAIRKRLTDTAIDLGASGRDPLFGYGLILATAAVQTPAPSPAPLTVKLIASSSRVKPGNTVTFTATPSRNTGIQRVEFYKDGVLVATDKGAPYQYLWKTVGQKAGKYTFLAKAYDTSGKGVSSNPVVVAVTATVTITSPKNGQVVSGIVNKFTAKFSDPVKGNVYLYIDRALKTSKNIAATTGPVTLGYTWNTKSLANGSVHQIMIKAYTVNGRIDSYGSVKVTVKN